MSLFRVVIALLVWLIPILGQANKPQSWHLQDTDQELHIGTGAQYIYLDTNADLTPSQALKKARRGEFEVVDAGVPSYGYNQGTAWIYLSLNGEALSKTDWFLLLRNPSLSEIDLYQGVGQRTLPRWRTGSTRSFHTRPLSHGDFVFPLDFSRNENQEWLVRVRSSIAMQLPVSLQEYDAFWTQEQYQQTKIGLFFGMALVMVIFNLFIFLMTGDRGYIPYIFLVLSFSTLLGTIEGLGFQFFWPESARLNDVVTAVSLACSGAAGPLLVNRFLNLVETRPKLSIALTLVTRMLCLVALAGLFMPFSTVIKPTMGLALLGISVTLLTGLLEWRNGSATARFFTLSWAGIVFGSFALALSKLGMLPRTTLTTYSLHYGAAAEFVILAIALGARLNHVRDETQIAQEESEKLRHQLNQEMQARIQIFSNIANALDKPLKALRGAAGQYRQSLATATYMTESIFHLADGNTQVTDMSLRAEKNNVDQRHHLTTFERHATRLDDVLSQMKTLSTGENQQITETPPLVELWGSAVGETRQALGDVFEHVQFKENISLKRKDPILLKGSPFILADTLKSMLAYCMRHALTGRMPVLHVRLHVEYAFVRITFASNGNPIAPEVAKELFEVEGDSRTTTKDLAVTRSIIRQQGGNVILRNSGRADRATEIELVLAMEHVSGSSKESSAEDAATDSLE